MAEHEELFREALECGKKRDYKKALEIFQFLAAEEFPEALFYLGRTYHGLSDYPRAVQCLQSHLRQAPEAPAAHFFLGRSLLALDLPVKAITHFLRSKRLGYDSPQLQGLLGTAYLKARNPALAVETLQQAVERAPQNRSFYIAYLNALFVHAVKLFRQAQFDLSRQILQFLIESGAEGTTVDLYMARALKELNRLEDALAYYRKVRTSHPDDLLLTLPIVEILFQIGRTEEARKEYAAIESLLPAGMTEKSAKHLELLMPFEHFQKGDYSQAVFYALKNLKSDPENPQMRLILAESYHQLGQADKALRHYRKTVQSCPDDKELRYGLIMLLWENECFDEAYAEIKKILARSSDDSTAQYYAVLTACHLNEPPEEIIPALQAMIRRRGPDTFLFKALAGEYIKSERGDLARGWLKKSLRLTPNDAPALEQLISLPPGYQDPDLEELFEGCLSFDPKNPEILRHYVRFLFKIKEYKKAQGRILSLIGLKKKSAALLKALAFTYRVEESWTEAFLVYKELLSLVPEDQEVQAGTMLCLVKTGRRELALQFAKKTQSNTRATPLFHYHLGQIYFALSEWSDALASFRKVLEEWPGHWQSVEKMSQIFAAQGDRLMSERFSTHARNMKEKAQN